ncbi:hypothetical protein [Psychrobacillus sp. MER TA 171]|uniref:hypothetical protein n=1 Tax=Psychrobacillus sp. MER TA 171 TaxID=2939577 RepID=UPI002041D990|nr:hypothetical protein [Psychrobacillus sp. MER TA 171]MCM3356807.1 hypothetical protein [Psychrobacillus sp. MER TA 171]
MVKMVFIHLSSLSNLSEQLKGEQGMRSHEELEEQLIAFIKQMPTMKSKADLIEAIESIYNIDIITFQNLLEKSYKEFEDWLNTLLSKEKIPKEIVAINFGIFDKKDSFQLYISGSTEWDGYDDDWASNNDYFPQGRYAEITAYKTLYHLYEEQFYLGLFLTLASTIIFTHTYLQTNISNFPGNIVFATGFDDGDLYNFCEKYDSTMVPLIFR